MNAISVITDLPFDRVCQTSLSTWWTNIIKREGGEAKQQQFLKKSYKGGYVIEPTKGYYQQSVYVLDVKSLYPTMMINNNISFDTVNCNCCKYIEEARVSAEIMDIINEGLTKEEKEIKLIGFAKRRQVQFQNYYPDSEKRDSDNRN